jgi:hypothetical protein
MTVQALAKIIEGYEVVSKINRGNRRKNISQPNENIFKYPLEYNYLNP